MARAQIGLPLEDNIEDAGDWGLLYADSYIIERWLHYDKTGQFPDGKPYDCQPKGLLETFKFLNHRLAYWVDREKPELKRQTQEL